MSRRFYLEWPANKPVKTTHYGDTQSILDKLVELGELDWEEHLSTSPGVVYKAYTIPQKKVVRAGYRRDDTTDYKWIITCSEHGRIDRTSEPGKWRHAYEQHVHFGREHPNDTVEWDDPPKKVAITYTITSNGMLTGTCSAAHASGRNWTYEDWGRTNEVMHDHVRISHLNDDVTFGPMPNPPHKHKWVWSTELYGKPGPGNQSRTVIVCSAHYCGKRFYYPEGFVGADYTGPVPPNL